MRVAVLVTVHNRVETTVRGLVQFALLVRNLDEFEFTVFLVDDGSTDGTAAEVRRLPLDIDIIDGTGSLYWNRGMILAHQSAVSRGEPFNAYMLYNDDTVLTETFCDLIKAFRREGNAIVAGAFTDASTGEVNYSGFLRVSRNRPLAFDRPQLVAGTLVPVDTFNGNLVLLPAEVFDSLGGLDPVFWHAFGDIDLGLRAQKLGIRSYVFGSPVGYCSRGTSLYDRVRVAGRRERWKLLFGRTAIYGFGQYLHFVGRHGVLALLPIYAAREAGRRALMLVPRPPTQSPGRR
ncbi:COG1216 Predicted glycosyltransferases [Mycobacteriaceae bacterium]